MVFQDPLTALNPVFTVGEQIVEVIRAHRPIGRRAARAPARRACWPACRSRTRSGAMRAYPHQLSGGMRQRVLIAMAIALRARAC